MVKEISTTVLPKKSPRKTPIGSCNEPGAIHKMRSFPIESEEEYSTVTDPYKNKNSPSKFVSIDSSRYSKDQAKMTINTDQEIVV